VVGADTNLLVRLLVTDDEQQQRAVRRRLEEMQRRGEGVLVTSLALAELCWVLQSGYGYARAQIAAAIAAIVETPPFVVVEREEVSAALEWYAEGPADFPDYLILALTRSRGGEKLLTFDRKLLKHPLCEKP
jgi:predicted nucleic-acid-binding protein